MGSNVTGYATEGTAIIDAFLILLVAGVLAGWLAAVVVRGSGYGLISNTVIGVVGAWVSRRLLGGIGVAIGGGFWGQVLNAFVGAVVVVFLVALVTD